MDHHRIDIPPKKARTIPEAVATARAAFAARLSRPLKFRQAQLAAIVRLLAERRPQLLAALHQDLAKPAQEALLTEINILEADARHSLYSLRQWVRPERPPKRWINLLDTVRIHKEPYGVVLIISPWNYPLLLSLGPLINAIAAGNCAIVKPSEHAPATSALLARLLPQYLHADCCQIVTGGAPAARLLLHHQFDYIFFTGSTQIGRIVHKAAAEHLTPTTLELGGKCPVFVDASADIKQATRRILWGRLLNAGQTCVAPDYLLCTQHVQELFVEEARDVIEQFYASQSVDLARIVDEKHFQRLVGLIQKSRVAIGGDFDVGTLRISPTIITDVKRGDRVMREEIFGPLLPILVVDGAEEALEYVNGRAKALAVYVFTRDRGVRELFVEGSSSGGVVVNDTIMHLAVEDLPFGGVGASGMGAYHGRVGFETFSHRKGVLMKRFGALEEWVMSARYPPYSNWKAQFLAMAMRKRRTIVSWKGMKRTALFVAGVGIGYGIHYFV